MTSELPVPVQLVVCGLPLPLSVMLSVAVRCPVAEGVNVTPIVQVLPAASELPQVSATWAKSLALVPVIARLVMLKAALPPLLRMIVWAVLVVATGWLPKERLLGERLATSAPPHAEKPSVRAPTKWQAQ